ncbi:hypothetical protein [Nocardioides alkalitolerans]|uniref:hypothetical protein n=1 Tax=Nocardioides alkalitolerans TaxID=281714 RepID=UPI00048CCB59|nr:hypothetical protein [Nocardioides alkalitolerans]
MPGTTEDFDIPYVEDSDPVKDGAAHTRALADRLEALFGAVPIIETGTATIDITGGLSGTVNIPFTKTFTSPPIVQATAFSGGGYWVVVGGTTSTVHTTIGVRQKDNVVSTDSIAIRWTAIGT